jgi:hypothetical protein
MQHWKIKINEQEIIFFSKIMYFYIFKFRINFFQFTTYQTVEIPSPTLLQVIMLNPVPIFTTYYVNVA